MASWDHWVEAALSRLASKKLLRSTRPISVPLPPPPGDPSEGLETFDGPRHWDRSSVEVEIEEPTLREWLNELRSPGGETIGEDEKVGGKLLLFSGNDYLGLSSHPAVRKAAAKDCLLCPTGFAANMAFLSALGSVSALLAVGRKPSKDERIAIFSDALNHASIIDGIHLAERRQEAEVFVYRHCDMSHLNALLLCCKMEKKIVITDSLFSMDGDFAPIGKLVELRKKHGFLLAIDDAHATLVCGENGGGVPEVHECENDVDICIGTLSKAAGCQGGFIACR
ncbi:putative 8-amino-7-oxononanoate synthase [Cocos nucifera]|nr:putative 8-amino-7-oxononanoate synthase [Cocos nucifera]